MVLDPKPRGCNGYGIRLTCKFTFRHATIIAHLNADYNTPTEILYPKVPFSLPPSLSSFVWRSCRRFKYN